MGNPARRSRASTPARRHVRRTLIRRAIERYLQYCYRNRTTAKVKELAGFLLVSRPYLSRAVSQVSGTSLREMLRDEQTAHAEVLLRLTRLNVREIAVRSGFGDVKTFYRAFLERHGETPGAYRSRLPNAHRRAVSGPISSLPVRKDGS